MNDRPEIRPDRAGWSAWASRAWDLAYAVDTQGNRIRQTPDPIRRLRLQATAHRCMAALLDLSADAEEAEPALADVTHAAGCCSDIEAAIGMAQAGMQDWDEQP